jgi:2-amino-4-hydroxy-6-hydroxymethyldihydropteridine diphosphokinase
VPRTIVIALGSNLGDRRYFLRRAVHELRAFVRVVRASSIVETDPVGAPPPRFLNMVVAGYTYLEAAELLGELHGIEARLGRIRTVRNAPRTIDLDLIRYSGYAIRTQTLTIPHPRYREREFVLGPMREISAPSS